jgi:hypothetical protein
VADSKITVNITTHDPTHGWVDCPLQDREYGICVAHDFLHPSTRPNQSGMKCPEGFDVEAGPMEGLYIYRIPDACPLRKGPVVVEGT